MKKLCPLLLALFLLLLPGCKEKPDLSGLPELELLREEDGEEYILLDENRYNKVPSQVLGSSHSGRWDLRAQPGRRVAVLRQDTIFTIQGDEEELFLYNVAESFRFGALYHYLFLREGCTLDLPDSAAAFDRGTIRTYASGGLFGKKAAITCELTDEALLTALFAVWDGTADTPPIPEGLDLERREGRALELWSKEHPWLCLYINCSWWPEGVVTLQNREGLSVRLPDSTVEKLVWEEPGLWQRLAGALRG